MKLDFIPYGLALVLKGKKKRRTNQYTLQGNGTAAIPKCSSERTYSKFQELKNYAQVTY